MRGIALVLCVSATVIAGGAVRARIPIEPPGYEHSGVRVSGEQDSGEPDLVVRRLYSLLAGREVRDRAFAFVPLHARAPSEARRNGAPLPHWDPAQVDARSAAAGVLRLRPKGKRPFLVVPGRAWSLGSLNVRAAELALVERGASVFVRAASGATTSSRMPGWIDARATGALLVDPAGAVRTAPFTREDLQAGAAYRRCEERTREFGLSGDRTVVGCVALVGGDPIAVFVFGDAPLFEAARADIVMIAVATAERLVREGTAPVLLRARAERANPRGRAIALLRAVGEFGARSREVPGGGVRWEAGSRRHGHVARALVDEQGRVVFFGAWIVPPEKSIAAGAKATGPVRADPEEDRTRRKGGRFNPLRNGGVPLFPPTTPGR